MSAQATQPAAPAAPPRAAAPEDRARFAGAERWIPAAVALVSVVGFVIRLLNLDQGLLADELSTYWIVHDRGLREVVDLVHSDAEITPPVYFVLSWATSHLGSDAMWLRLPSLVCGSLSIPLLYLLGARTIGKTAGALGATLFALSPFMIYYSTEARAYSVMIFLLIVSTLALVSACEGRSKAWWALYAASICLAMLSHYTAIFYLIAQFLWAAWAYPLARRWLLGASVAAAVGFLPWITGFIADNNSPTTAILNALQPFDFTSVKYATEQWGVGYPYVPLHSAPGRVAIVLLIAAAVIALVGIAVRAYRRRATRPRLAEALPPRAGLVLVVLLALATPAGEALSSAVSTNLYGARNLDAAWPGLALALGAALVAAGPIAGTLAAVAAITGYGIGASHTLDPDFARTNYRDAAAFIDSKAKPGDVILDGAALTPVPTTGLDVFLSPGHREIRLDLPRSDRPFMVGDPVPSPVVLTQRAFREGRGHQVIVLAFLPTPVVRAGAPHTDPAHRRVTEILKHPPYGFHRVERKVFPGIPRLAALIYRSDSSGSG